MSNNKSVGSWLIDNWISIIAIILMVLSSASYFVKGGIWVAVNARNWINFALPAATAVGVIFLLKKYVKSIINREKDWYYSIFFFITFLVMMFLGLVYGPNDPTYKILFDIFINAGQSGIAAMTGFAFASLTFRVLYLKNWRSTVMAIVFILGITAITPLGEFVPILKDMGQWIILYIGTPIDQAIWMGMYAAMTVLFIRILFFKEKLSPKTEIKGE
jgi:hypothetical protein